jgi:hypothetical protein
MALLMSNVSMEPDERVDCFKKIHHLKKSDCNSHKSLLNFKKEQEKNCSNLINHHSDNFELNVSFIVREY